MPARLRARDQDNQTKRKHGEGNAWGRNVGVKIRRRAAQTERGEGLWPITRI